MSNQPKLGVAYHATRTEQLIFRLMLSAGYITVVIGYLIGILEAYHLTPFNFLVFTLSRILYCAILWFSLARRDQPLGYMLFCMVLLLALTVGSGMLALLGIYFDFLLYFVTVVVFFLCLSPRPAIILTILLYVGSVCNFGFIDGWRGFDVNWLTMPAGFIFFAIFSLTNRMLNEQRQRTEKLLHQLEVSNAELEQAHEQLQNYANEVEELTIVRERTRVAREIHDTLGHYLTILTIQLETISKLQERDPARAALEVAEARRVAAQSMQEVRNAVAALRPTSIATLNLTEALTQLGKEFERNAEGTELTLDLDTQLTALSPDIHVALYRVAQETLTNVRKHAHATKVLIRLRYEEDLLELVILDNGRGSSIDNADQPCGGFGLIGLRERIELLGGYIMYGPAQPSGYRVTIQLRIPSTSSSIPTSVGAPLAGALDSKEAAHDPAYSRADC